MTRRLFGAALAAALCAARAAADPVPAGSLTGPADPTRAVVTGVVVDEAGRPVARAEVRALWRPPGVPLATTTTADDGRFRLQLDQPSVGNAMLLVTTADRGRLALRFCFEFGDAAAADVRAVVRPGRELAASVVDAAGAPVADAAVA